MKKILIFTMLVLLMATNVRGQDTTRLKRIEYVIGSSLGFSLVDYVGHNLIRIDNTTPSWYRGVEAGIQIAISYFLYKTCGLPSAISFNLIWWTWGDDLGYYGWATLINPPSDGHHWENRSWNGLQVPVTWAGWTPVGLLRPQQSPIAESTLLAQAIIGLSVSIAILW